MDADGEVLHRLGPRTIEGFERARDLTIAFLATSARAETGNRDAQRELLSLRLEMKKVRFNQAVEAAAAMEFTADQRLAYETLLVEALSRMPLEQARQALAGVDLQPGPQARAEEILVDLEIQQTMRPLLGPMRAIRRGEKAPERPYGICYELWEKGMKPSATSYLRGMYWDAVRRVADDKENAAAFAEAAVVLREAYQGNKGYLEAMEKRLKELR